MPVETYTGMGNNESQTAMAHMHPLGRWGQDTNIADAIVFLASDKSGFMTGSELVVDGGMTAG